MRTRRDLFSQELTGVGRFIPICQRNGQLGATPVELPDSCFTPDEVDRRRRKDQGRLFDAEVWRTRRAAGQVPGERQYRPAICQTHATRARAPSLSRPFRDLIATVARGCRPFRADCRVGADSWRPRLQRRRRPAAHSMPHFCYLGPEDLAFATGGGSASTARNKLHDFLPSFNMRASTSRRNGCCDLRRQRRSPGRISACSRISWVWA